MTHMQQLPDDRKSDAVTALDAALLKQNSKDNDLFVNKFNELMTWSLMTDYGNSLYYYFDQISDWDTLIDSYS